MDLLISVSGLAVPAFLICRYRAVGLLIAIPLGRGIPGLLTLTAGHESWHESRHFFRLNAFVAGGADVRHYMKCSRLGRF